MLRVAFFALLLINLAYFAWAHWVDVATPVPASELTKLPRLKLAEEVPPGEREPAGTAERAAVNDPSSCLSVGPFADLDDSARASTFLRQRGLEPRQRAEEGPSSQGYWVYVAGLKSEADADKALVTLEHGGIRDAVLMPELPDASRRLSLGMYSERARAEKRAQTVKDQAGIKAEIAERKFPATNYWLDVSSPPEGGLPLQELTSNGLSPHVAVEPCPAQPAPATGTATARPTSAHGSATSAARDTVPATQLR